MGRVFHLHEVPKGAEGSLVLSLKEEKQLIRMLPPKNGKRGAVVPLSLYIPQVGTRPSQGLGARCCVQGCEPRLVPSNCGHLKGSMEMISTV